ncbi:hypothetical protein Tco_0105695 [Tanacetum coccineum]
MSEENLPAPTRSDEQLVPVKAHLPYGKSNLLLDLQKLQKNPIFHISVDILQNTNFFRAFSASANVPSIYIQQFWNTLTQEPKTGITLVDPTNPFVLPPAGEIVMDFVNELGYPEGIMTRTNVDYAKVLWEEFVQGIQTFFTHRDSNKIPSKKPTPHVIPYCRFTKLIIYYLGSKYNIHRRPESPRHVTGYDFLLGNLKFIPKGEKDEVFGMLIPKELITEAIQKSEYYKQYVEMATRKIQAKEGGKKKTTPKADKPLKPAPAKQPKPKPVKERSTKPTLLQKASKGKVQKVRKGKSPLKLIDEDEEVHHEPEPQGVGEDYDLNRAIQMSLETFQAHGQAPVGGQQLDVFHVKNAPMTEAYFEAIAKKEQNILEKEDTTLSLPSKEASPVVEGPLDASKDTILSSALHDVPLEVVFAVHDDEESTSGKTIVVEYVGIEQNELVYFNMGKSLNLVVAANDVGNNGFSAMDHQWQVRCNLEESNIVATYGNDMGITNHGPRLKDEAIKKLKERTQMSKKRLKIWDPGIKIIFLNNTLRTM